MPRIRYLRDRAANSGLGERDVGYVLARFLFFLSKITPDPVPFFLCFVCQYTKSKHQ